jgi:hypothetical protein
MSAQSNPNLKGLDVFLADVDKVSAEKHIPAATVALIKTQIVKDAATTTDLRKKFESIVSRSVTRSPDDPSLAGLWARIAGNILNIFTPGKAYAQAAGQPFGGELDYTFYCDCSDSWLVGIEPLPPNYVALLSYEEGTQAYLSYNIPFTEWLLGFYEDGEGMCQEYVGEDCVDVPSEGSIMPTVGSSL